MAINIDSMSDEEIEQRLANLRAELKTNEDNTVKIKTEINSILFVINKRKRNKKLI